MKVNVLQGLNLKNPVTTVRVEMEAVKPDLLDFFKNLHPVFMEGYKITGTTFEVQTHLPNLWKNETFLQAIEDFSTGKKSLDDAKTSILEVTKLLVSSMSTIPVLHAAHQMGYETHQFYVNKGILPKKLLNKYYSIGIGKEAQVTVAAGSTLDSILAFKTQRDKSFTNQFIEEMDFPIAKWALVESRDDLPRIAEEIGLPLVMKPVGLTAGHGVYVGLKTVKELEETYDKIHKYFDEMEHPKAAWQKKIIVQEVVKGDDYRVLVINGTVEIATHRIPARVVGDGKHTIRELIDIENQNPARDITLPTHTLKFIVIDDDLIKIVRDNGFELDDIPEKDEIVYVRKVASMSQGGITADVTDKIHPQTKLICEAIGKTVHACVLGVDVLCQDISKPLTPENGSIIEMNTMPEVYLNAFPVIGKQYPDIGKTVISSLISKDLHTNRVVAVGNIENKEVERIVVESLGKQEKIGSLRSGVISINGNEINKDVETESGVLSLKKNRSLDTIVLHYDNVAEIEENGLGFDTIDLLVATKGEYEKIKDKIDEYKSNNLITKVEIQ